jgi:hypothetical protein
MENTPPATKRVSPSMGLAMLFALLCSCFWAYVIMSSNSRESSGVLGELIGTFPLMAPLVLVDFLVGTSLSKLEILTHPLLIPIGIVGWSVFGYAVGISWSHQFGNQERFANWLAWLAHGWITLLVGIMFTGIAFQTFGRFAWLGFLILFLFCLTTLGCLIKSGFQLFKRNPVDT